MSGHWAQRGEIGSAWGLRLMFEISRRLGRWPFRVAVMPVVLYFYLTQQSKRAASRQYLERLFATRAPGLRPSAFQVFRHFLAQGESILDRILAWDPKTPPPRATAHGREALAARLDGGEGLLIIGSHLGNMEVARSLAWNTRNVRVNVLVHTLHNPSFIGLMKRINPGSQTALMQVTEITPATAVVLKERIDAGEVVLIAGDRVPLNGKGTVRAPFLGHDAAFPVGPYVLASLLECPVFLLFCLGGNRSYSIHYELFSERVILNRATRRRDMTGLAARYAERLAHYCALSPLDWGNMYGFWDGPEAGER